MTEEVSCSASLKMTGFGSLINNRAISKAKVAQSQAGLFFAQMKYVEELTRLESVGATQKGKQEDEVGEGNQSVGLVKNS